MKPLVKWVGGKRQLLHQILPLLPSSINTLIEPFVGGGAVFLTEANPKSIINDTNAELINLYKTVESNPIELMNTLDSMAVLNNKDYYIRVRDWDKTGELETKNNIEKAARFIFLTKLSFNGLYRTNNKGKLNMAYNNEPNPTYYTRENILKISNYLKNHTIIKNMDYEEVIKDAKPADFIYIDPPYDYENSTGFVSYGADKWSKNDTIKLSKTLKNLDAKKVNWMLSNNNTELIRDLFKDYNTYVVKAKRSINTNGEGRGSVEEVIITNYDNYRYLNERTLFSC